MTPAERILRYLADHAGVIVDPVSAMSVIAGELEADLHPVTVKDNLKRLDEAGLVSRRLPHARSCTGVRLTAAGWAQLGVQGTEPAWPQMLPREAPQHQERPVDLDRVARAWARRPKDHPARRVVSVQNAMRCSRERALELIDRCREAGTIPSLANFPRAEAS